MGEDLIWTLLRMLMLLSLSILLLCVVSMGIYDVRQARRDRKERRSASTDYARRRLPSFTILIPAFNEELVIERTLTSVCKQNYPSFSVVVVNDASADATSRKARAFIKSHPKTTIRLVNLRRNRGKGGALNYALRRYCDSDLLMILDADSSLAPDALYKAAKYFDDPKTVGLSTHVQISAQPSPLSYMQKIEYLLAYRHKKYISVTNSEFIIGGQGSTFRKDTVLKVGGFSEHLLTEDMALSMSIAKLGNRANRLVFAGDVISYTEAPGSLNGVYHQRYRWKLGGLQTMYEHRDLIMARTKAHNPMLTWFRIPQTILSEFSVLLEPLLLCLFITIAVATHNLGIFFGGWLALTSYVIFNITDEDTLSKRDRYIMLAYAPFMYLFFYVITVINIVAMVRCLYNWRKIVGKKKTGGSWISPKRIGAGVQG